MVGQVRRVGPGGPTFLDDPPTPDAIHAEVERVADPIGRWESLTAKALQHSDGTDVTAAMATWIDYSMRPQAVAGVPVGELLGELDELIGELREQKRELASKRRLQAAEAERWAAERVEQRRQLEERSAEAEELRAQLSASEERHEVAQRSLLASSTSAAHRCLGAWLLKAP